jgi:hypothetical protein
VLDAFSSDAIPAHLLTREAFELYFHKLRPDGRLLVHISNRHLDLAIVLGAVARDLGLVALRQSHEPGDSDRDLLSSTWVLLARSPEALGAAARDDRWVTLDAPPGARAWTDDYSSLLSVLKLHR